MASTNADTTRFVANTPKNVASLFNRYFNSVFSKATLDKWTLDLPISNTTVSEIVPLPSEVSEVP